jgi:Arc/MetJ-type ribon-helix-helix transcriptional regulator
MTSTVSYEIHVMRGGRWVTTGIYQDKSEALRDARGPMRKRHLAIRVVEEVLDPERERFISRAVYHDVGRAEAAAARHNADAAPSGGAITVDAAMSSSGESLKAMGLTVIGLSAALLMGIAGLFWFGLV